MSVYVAVSSAMEDSAAVSCKVCFPMYFLNLFGDSSQRARLSSVRNGTGMFDPTSGRRTDPKTSRGPFQLLGL